MEARERPIGRFITLEGPDGAGKTMQAQRLAESLRDEGLRVVLTREPGGTPLGERIRDLLLDPTAPGHGPQVDALLFNAARAQHVAELIRPALAQGAVVVCDRFVDSTLAYQGYGGGLDVEELARVSAWASDGLVPDLTILLDLPVDAGLARRAGGPAAGRTRFEDEARHDRAFHERVRAGFLALAAREPDRWRIVDAARDADTVAADVLAAAGAFMGLGEPNRSRERITT
jgi:dTMP kinase